MQAVLYALESPSCTLREVAEILVAVFTVKMFHVERRPVRVLICCCRSSSYYMLVFNVGSSLWVPYIHVTRRLPCPSRQDSLVFILQPRFDVHQNIKLTYFQRRPLAGVNLDLAFGIGPGG